MEKILETIKKTKGFKATDIISDVDGNRITHIYAKHKSLSFCFIAPHGGNDNKYLLRVNRTETLDKWGFCELEKSYYSEKSLIENLDLLSIYDEIIKVTISKEKEFSNKEDKEFYYY